MLLDRLIDIVIEFWDVLGEMSPYLLLGFLVAGILYVYIPSSFVEKHLGGKGILPSIKASIFGVPLPLCSCGVIPVAASLRQSGATRGATTAFLISTPQTGVDSIAVTYSLLGPVFAIFRPIAALINGVIGGLIVNIFLKGNDKEEYNRNSVESDTDCGCDGSCKSPKINNNTGKFYQAMRYGFYYLPKDIGKALLIGLIIAGFISALVPDDYLAGIFGAGIGAMIVMMIVGIPIYVCATASVPVAAALILKGISPGAAFVFLMTGPATNAATIAVIWKTMGHKTAYIYLITVAVTALLSGLILDYIFVQSGTTASPAMPFMFSPWFKSASSIVLLCLLGYALLRKPSPGEISDIPETSQKAVLKVAGMTCTHCLSTVKKAILESPGVEAAKVDLSTGIAEIAGNDFDLERLKKKITSLGYSIES